MYWKGLAGGMPSTRASVRGKCEFYDPQQRQGYLSVAGWAPDVHVLFRAEDVLGPPPAGRVRWSASWSSRGRGWCGASGRRETFAHLLHTYKDD